MAVYTRLQKEEIEKILSNYNLTLKNFYMIKTGILNTNYYIECIEGKFVLRVFEGGRKYFEENQELEFLLELKDIVPCCTPLQTTSGNNYIVYKNKMIALFYFIVGEPIKSFNEAYLKEIGKYLGVLHSFSIGKKLIRKSRIDMEKYYKKIDFKNIDIPFDIKEKIKILYDEVKIFNFSSLPCGVIHNDIFPDNIFVKDNKIVKISLCDVAGKTKMVDPGNELITQARQLGICLGE